MKLAVFFSGQGSNLKALLDSDVAPAIGLLLTDNPTAPGLQYGRIHNIPTVVLDYKAYDSKASFENALLWAVQPYQPQYIVLAGFMRILSESFIGHYNNRIINIHPSLLPSYKGLDTHARALKKGNKIHGITVHFVTKDVDTGPIIAQGALPVHPQDTVFSLQQRIKQLEHFVYPKVISWLIAGQLRINEQGLVCTPTPSSFFMTDFNDAPTCPIQRGSTEQSIQ